MILSNSANIKQLDLTKELINVSNTEMPFTSLLLKNGRQKATSTTVNWAYEQLDSTKGLVKEGIDVTTFQESDRTGGNSNVCQILNKGVSVSFTAQQVSQESIADLFAHELKNRITEIKRDLEFYLINGVRDEGTGATPRQMNGLLEFVEEENIVNNATLTIKELQEMAKKMKQAGTASQNMVLLCDYNTFDKVADLFADKTYYQGVTNEFGSPVHKLNLTYGAVVPYLVADLPVDTALMVNMDFLKLPELRALTYYDLATTGSAKRGFIEVENTLKVLHPSAITKYAVAV